ARRELSWDSRREWQCSVLQSRRFPAGSPVNDFLMNDFLPYYTQSSAMRTSFAYCSLAYSALACLRMGISGSAFFQRVRKSL
ncbi:MAG TPA: hypothetical protein VMF10_04390, partial [Candidatus Aquilonibacter sp.]|nr:hypothetical protein [Candidatus Aquilonibacter sp.]